MPPEPKKGELNKSFGIYVERPFFIVSGMESEKYIDLIGNNAVIKTPNGRTSQSWWFDQKSKTIHSTRTRSYSLGINSNGRGNNLQVMGTNSQWW